MANCETQELTPEQETDLDRLPKELGPLIKQALIEDPGLIPPFLPILEVGSRLGKPLTIDQAKLLISEIEEPQTPRKNPQEVDFSPGRLFLYFLQSNSSSPPVIYFGVAQKKEEPSIIFWLKCLPVGKIITERHLTPILTKRTKNPRICPLHPLRRSLVSVDELLAHHEELKKVAT